MDGIESNTTLPVLPEAVHPILDELKIGQSLGASRYIRRINDLFCAIAEHWGTDRGQELIRCLLATGDYFIEIRGRNTPAVSNAIHLVLKGLGQYSSSNVAAIREFISTRRTEYNTQSIRNIDLIATYGANLFANRKAILAFDYSSTMMAILKKLADWGHHKYLIVTEGRDMVGGQPIVQEATDFGHTVNFVLDMAFHHFLPEVDAVLAGAETLFANGDCWNTVGSLPIAVVSNYYNVPFYVTTELIKIDARSFQGIRKPIKPVDYSDLFDYPASFKHPELVSVSAPNLDNVPGNLISGYITERGVLLPANIYAETLNFLGSIGVMPLL